MEEVDIKDYDAKISELNDKLLNNTVNSYKGLQDAENDYYQLRISNLQKLADKQESYNRSINEELLKKGFSNEAILANYKKQIAKAQAIEAAKGDKAKIKEIEKEYAAKTKEEKKLEKTRQKAITALGAAERDEQAKKLREGNLLQRAGTLKNTFTQKVYDKEGNELGKKASFLAGLATLNTALATALADFAATLKKDINDIASNKSDVDTRLQGWGGKSRTGSHWEAFSNDYIGIAGVSPLVKQADIVNNLKSMVGQGIAFNVEQRAFLATVKNKIATTFDATNGTLLRLVRIQQADTTAARLGMESALTSFLNNMYETTEYMQEAARSVRSSLEEASALMSAEGAVEFEYQVQKWMGSLYSVGFKNTEGLASALGKLAAGDIGGITEGGFGNLLIMAANKSGIAISDILVDGLDESNTNKLMAAVVEYLSDIYDDTHNSKLLSQQYANVFGLSASDLKAAANLARSTKNISGQNLSYGGMLSQLNSMADSMYARTSIGEMLTNALENVKYSMAGSIASNPALYAIYTFGSMLKQTTGGFDIPLPMVMGTGLPIALNVADLMLTGSMMGDILSGIGQMISAGSGGGLSGSGMLRALGVGSGTAITSRGTGSGLLRTSGSSVSNSGYVGNSEGSDIQNKTITDATDDANTQVQTAQEESSETTLSNINDSVMLIYHLLEDVTLGTKHLHTYNSLENTIW